MRVPGIDLNAEAPETIKSAILITDEGTRNNFKQNLNTKKSCKY